MTLKRLDGKGVFVKTYVERPIIVRTNKKSDNLLDVVRGCEGAVRHGGRGCYGACYAVKMARRASIDFSTPVPGILREDALRNSLMVFRAKNRNPWVRIGSAGDPCFDWGLTTDVVEICAEEQVTPVIVTMAWNIPSHEILTRLARAEAVLHVSWTLDVGAPEKPGLARSTLLENYEYPRRVLRVCSIGFRVSYQREVARAAGKMGFLIIETPFRLNKKSPVWDIVTQSLYKPHVSPWTGKPDNQVTAGRILKGERVVYCDTTCDRCDNQCGTLDKFWEFH